MALVELSCSRVSPSPSKSIFHVWKVSPLFSQYTPEHIPDGLSLSETSPDDESTDGYWNRARPVESELVRLSPA